MKSFVQTANASQVKDFGDQLKTVEKKKAEALVPAKRNPFGQIKRDLTEEKKNRILSSVQHLAIMAEMIGIEYQMEMDVLYRDPYLNNLTNRIGTDCLSIDNRIRKGNLPRFTVKDKDFAEDYAGELHRLFKLFIGMDLQKIKDLLDGWEAISKNVEDPDDLNYITIGFTPLELQEIAKFVKRKGITDGLKIKFEAVIKESIK